LDLHSSNWLLYQEIQLMSQVTTSVGGRFCVNKVKLTTESLSLHGPLLPLPASAGHPAELGLMAILPWPLGSVMVALAETLGSISGVAVRVTWKPCVMTGGAV